MLIKIHTLYTYSTERRLTLALLAGLAGMVFIYIFLVGVTAFVISKQENIQSNMQALDSRISDLETEYTALNATIDRAHALSLGFMKPKKEIFAFRQRLVQNGF